MTPKKTAPSKTVAKTRLRVPSTRVDASPGKALALRAEQPMTTTYGTGSGTITVTVTHPTPHFTGTVTVLGTVVLPFTDGTATVTVPGYALGAIGAAGFEVTIGTQSPAPPYDANLDTLMSPIVSNAASTTSAALRAAYVAQWTANETIGSGIFRLSPTGQIIQRNSSGTTRSTYDSTEQALWTVVSSGGGAVSSVAGQTGAVTGAQIAADSSMKAAFAAYAATVLSRWNTRRRTEYDRDNAPGFTVFIDSVNGNDANTGNTPAQAWKTLGKLTTAGVAYGARIGLRRGSAFSGAFTFPAPSGTGAWNNRVVIGAYGQGATPTLSGTFTIQQPYIDVQDLRFTGSASGYALFIFNATAGVMIGNQVKRCELDNNTSTGGLIMGVAGGLVEDCYFHDIWNNVEYPSGSGYAALFTTGTDNTDVRYNTVRNCYKGLASGNTHRDLLIRNNIVDKCRVNGIDMGGGGVVGYPPRIINNFVWHRPTTPNGHGIDTQASLVGPVWRNNIVYCDYNGVAGNVELYCIDQTTYSSVDTDYNLGFIAPTAANVNYGKLGTNTYATLSAFQTALAGTSYAGKEAHSISADPLIADLTNLAFVPLPGSPAINAGQAVSGVNDAYLGTAPDLGAYEVA